MRIGQVYDAHRLAAGKKLVLGGIEIPYEKGLEGNSDADVLTHAIMDALLGAAALGDIGTLFPDTDARSAGASSIKLWEEVAYRLRAASYTHLNCGPMLETTDPAVLQKMEDELYDGMMAAVNGEYRTKNEINGYYMYGTFRIGPNL